MTEQDIDRAEPSSAPTSEPEAAPVERSEVTADEIAGAVEALLLMAEEPLSATVLAAAVVAPVTIVEQCLADLARFYDETRRGFELRHLGGGWRYYTRAEHADVIAGHVRSGQSARLSQAALETLAVIAYSQPISRSRVAAVRGVGVDGVVRTLLARNLIAEVGTDPESGAIVFGTTDHFLERLGLSGLDELPDLAPHLPEATELEAELSRLATVPDLTADGDDDGPSGHAGQDPLPPDPAPADPAPADPAPPSTDAEDTGPAEDA